VNNACARGELVAVDTWAVDQDSFSLSLDGLLRPPAEAAFLIGGQLLRVELAAGSGAPAVVPGAELPFADDARLPPVILGLEDGALALTALEDNRTLRRWRLGAPGPGPSRQLPSALNLIDFRRHSQGPLVVGSDPDDGTWLIYADPEMPPLRLVGEPGQSLVASEDAVVVRARPSVVVPLDPSLERIELEPCPRGTAPVVPDPQVGTLRQGDGWVVAVGCPSELRIEFWDLASGARLARQVIELPVRSQPALARLGQDQVVLATMDGSTLSVRIFDPSSPEAEPRRLAAELPGVATAQTTHRLVAASSSSGGEAGVAVATATPVGHGLIELSLTRFADCPD
jgi:hypothetical protein